MSNQVQTPSSLKPLDSFLAIVLGIVAGVTLAGPYILLGLPFVFISYIFSGFDKNIFGELLEYLVIGAPVALLLTGVFVAVCFFFHTFILSKYQKRNTARKWLWSLFLVPLIIGVAYLVYSSFKGLQTQDARNQQEVQREVDRQNIYPVIAGTWHIVRDGNSYTFAFTDIKTPNLDSKQRKLSIKNESTNLVYACSYLIGEGPPYYDKYSISVMCPSQDAPLLGKKVGSWQTIRQMTLEESTLKFTTSNNETLIFTK